jgi:hypothetical protein
VLNSQVTGKHGRRRSESADDCGVAKAGVLLRAVQLDACVCVRCACEMIRPSRTRDLRLARSRPSTPPAGSLEPKTAPSFAFLSRIDSKLFCFSVRFALSPVLSFSRRSSWKPKPRLRSHTHAHAPFALSLHSKRGRGLICEDGRIHENA